jgi:hypothetical protein
VHVLLDELIYKELDMWRIRHSILVKSSKCGTQNVGRRLLKAAVLVLNSLYNFKGLSLGGGPPKWPNPQIFMSLVQEQLFQQPLANILSSTRRRLS